MLAIYEQAPQDSTKCAIVDPANNTVAWVNRNNGTAHVAEYQDLGEIWFSRSVPHLVEKLVFEKTGTRIRFGCN